jgi:hypothetical protein
MRNLLRSLMLALVLVPALAVPSAKALTVPSTLEACVDESGLCSGSGAACATKSQCGPGQTCICQ